MKAIVTFSVLILFVLIDASGTENKYNSYASLQKNEVEGVDYQIISLDQNSEITVFAIHGGFIEPTTSEIALELSQGYFNYYSFEGIKKKNNWDLHVSSHLFDEPIALEFTRKSRVCISIHGFKDVIHNRVCLGGLNINARNAIFRNLVSNGIIDQSEENPCRNYKATSLKNIVNRCSENGVQIEVSTALRDQLRSNRGLMREFAESVRSALVGK